MQSLRSLQNPVGKLFIENGTHKLEENLEFETYFEKFKYERNWNLTKKIYLLLNAYAQNFIFILFIYLY